MISLMRRCTVCVHPDRATIDAELLQGISYPTVAGRHGLSTTAVYRHRRRHVDAPTVGDIVVPVDRGDFWREWDGTKWQRIAAPAGAPEKGEGPALCFLEHRIRSRLPLRFQSASRPARAVAVTPAPPSRAPRRASRGANRPIPPWSSLESTL